MTFDFAQRVAETLMRTRRFETLLFGARIGFGHETIHAFQTRAVNRLQNAHRRKQKRSASNCRVENRNFAQRAPQFFQLSRIADVGDNIRKPLRDIEVVCYQIRHVLKRDRVLDVTSYRRDAACCVRCVYV